MLTAEHKILRRGKIGGTLMSAIAGVSPYKTPADAYLELRGELDEQAGNDAMRAGTILERAVLDWCEKEIESDITRDLFFDFGDFCASLDGTTGGERPAIIEAKTTGIVGPRNWEYGEPGTDQVPNDVIVQVQHYMGLCDFYVAIIPVLIGGEGFRMYRVERDDQIIGALSEIATNFMRDHVLPGVMPGDSMPSLEVLKRRRREPGKAVDVSPELVDALIATRAAVKQAEKDAEDAEISLISALGDGGAASVNGQIKLTYLEQTQSRLDADAIRRHFPEVARECEKEIRFRSLRVKKLARS